MFKAKQSGILMFLLIVFNFAIFVTLIRSIMVSSDAKFDEPNSDKAKDEELRSRILQLETVVADSAAKQQVIDTLQDGIKALRTRVQQLEDSSTTALPSDEIQINKAGYDHLQQDVVTLRTRVQQLEAGIKNGATGVADKNEILNGAPGSSTINDVGMKSEHGNVNLDAFPVPSKLGGANAVNGLEPFRGKHKAENDAIFALAEGYQLDKMIAFVESLKDTNYTGDLVLGLNWTLCDEETQAWLEETIKLSQQVSESAKPQGPNIVLYASFSHGCPLGISTKDRTKNACQAILYKDKNTNLMLPDPRPARHVAMFRFEAYWLWIQHYSATSRIATLDVRDIFFQRHPFQNEYLARTTPEELHVFAEGGKPLQQTATGWWMVMGFGPNSSKHPYYQDKHPINGGAFIGGRDAMDVYLRALVHLCDVQNWGDWGSDQVYANIAIYNHTVLEGTNVKVVLNHQGVGAVNTIGAFQGEKDLVLFSNNNTAKTDQLDIVYNWDGHVSPILHQIEKGLHTYPNFAKYKNKHISDFREKRKALAASKSVR